MYVCICYIYVNICMFIYVYNVDRTRNRERYGIPVCSPVFPAFLDAQLPPPRVEIRHSLRVPRPPESPQAWGHAGQRRGPAGVARTSCNCNLISFLHFTFRLRGIRGRRERLPDANARVCGARNSSRVYSLPARLSPFSTLSILDPYTLAFIVFFFIFMTRFNLVVFARFRFHWAQSSSSVR